MITEKHQRYKPGEIFDNKLKKYRIEKNISAVQLAKMSGIRQSAISGLELGKISPFDQKGNLKKSIYIICDILQCEISDVFHRDYCKIPEESIFDNYIKPIYEIDYHELKYEQEFDKISYDDILNKILEIFKKDDYKRKPCGRFYFKEYYIYEKKIQEITYNQNITRSNVSFCINKILELLKKEPDLQLLKTYLT